MVLSMTIHSQWLGLRDNNNNFHGLTPLFHGKKKYVKTHGFSTSEAVGAVIKAAPVGTSHTCRQVPPILR